jgi:hypothetical protein
MRNSRDGRRVSRPNHLGDAIGRYWENAGQLYPLNNAKCLQILLPRETSNQRSNMQRKRRASWLIGIETTLWPCRAAPRIVHSGPRGPVPRMEMQV